MPQMVKSSAQFSLFIPFIISSHLLSSFILVTHLGEGLLVVVFELQWIDVELVLVAGEGVVVLGLLGEELLDLHRDPLAAVLEGLDGYVRGSHRIWGRGGGVQSKRVREPNLLP